MCLKKVTSPPCERRDAPSCRPVCQRCKASVHNCGVRLFNRSTQEPHTQASALGLFKPVSLAANRWPLNLRCVCCYPSGSKREVDFLPFWFLHTHTPSPTQKKENWYQLISHAKKLSKRESQKNQPWPGEECTQNCIIRQPEIERQAEKPFKIPPLLLREL